MFYQNAAVWGRWCLSHVLNVSQKHWGFMHHCASHPSGSVLPADAGNRGFGIVDVRGIPQKYGGLLYIEHDGERFIAILAIVKPCFAIYNGQDTK